MHVLPVCYCDFTALYRQRAFLVMICVFWLNARVVRMPLNLTGLGLGRTTFFQLS